MADFYKKSKKYIYRKWDDYMSGGVTKICPRCDRKNIVSYPTTICSECEYTPLNI